MVMTGGMVQMALFCRFTHNDYEFSCSIPVSIVLWYFDVLWSKHWKMKRLNSLVVYQRICFPTLAMCRRQEGKTIWKNLSIPSHQLLVPNPSFFKTPSVGSLCLLEESHRRFLLAIAMHNLYYSHVSGWIFQHDLQVGALIFLKNMSSSFGILILNTLW